MIPYDLIRSKRKSIVIIVKNDKVTVKAPLRTDVKWIDKFVVDKESWIRRKLQESAARSTSLADILSGTSFLYMGERLQPYVNDRATFSVDRNFLLIPKRYCEQSTGMLANTKEAHAAMKRFYRRIAKPYLENRLHALSVELKLSYTQFSLTNAKGKWGSCDAKNRIRLNWHLIMLPSDVIDYVIIHELMHTVEHNHSPAFWQSVARIYPRYKEAKRCLKDVGALIELYS